MESRNAEHRRDGYKNKGNFKQDELRRRREEQQVEIRRQKREENISKRRNLMVDAGPDSDDDIGASGNWDAPIQQMVQDVFSDDPIARRVLGFYGLDATTREEPTNQKVIQCGVVNRFVEFLRGGHGMLQFEAAWSLTNIASGTADHTQAVIHAGRTSPVVDVREQAVWALGNIAGDSPACPKTQLSMLRNATWTLSNFCRGRAPRPDWELISPALGALAKLIYSLDDEVLIDACWAISYLSDGSNDKIQAVIESGMCRRLTPALRAVGNIVTGDDLQTQVAIASGALPALLSLLSSAKDGIRKRHPGIIDANIMPPLIDIMRHGDLKLKKEACWAISNATAGGLQEPSQIRYLVSQGAIPPLCELLTTMDNKVIQVALDGLENILKVGEMDKQAAGPGASNQYALYVEEAGGMATIYNLQQHENLDIYNKAFHIMDKYFPDEDEADANAAPTRVDATGSFAFSQDVAAPQGGFTFGR
ncbi:ARM repeat-containing protein [Auriculariales sp. MPI-PUGE-AT-0066]|nr:ARM repeat-containing protein [Auriculariales sp. MPI-PUGE-AT-0066]